MASRSPRFDRTLASAQPQPIPRLDGTDQTLADVLRLQAKYRPDHCAAIFAERRTTYQQLHERSSRVALALRAEGLRKGDSIAHLGENSEEYLELFFGCVKAGVIAVPLDSSYTAASVSSIVKDCGAKLLFVAPGLVDCASEIALDLPDVRLIVAMEEVHTDWPSFARWYGIRPAADPMVPLEPTDPVLQLYPSSAAGRPKGTRLTHRSLIIASDATCFEE